MIVCGIDLETSGLTKEKDEILEVAWIIKPILDPKPLLVKTYYVYHPGVLEVSEEIYELTKITRRHLDKGRHLCDVVDELESDLVRHAVDFVVAHNGLAFDKPFLEAKHFSAYLSKLPWLDTKIDLRFPKSCKMTNLTYLAAFHGFLNPFPHSAVFDVATMLKLLDTRLEEDGMDVFHRARTPVKFVQAMVGYNERELAKKRGYQWEQSGGRTFPKSWVKQLREFDVDTEIREAGFPVTVLSE
jgi:DNA polymerase-3 subunit epsilon